MKWTFAAVAVVACLSVGARAEVIDRVLAVVGGQLITLSDVTAARDLRLVPPEQTRGSGSCDSRPS